MSLALETDTSTRTVAAPTEAPLLGRLYEVDGRKLALHCAGSGQPTVVFMPGAGLIGLDFLNVQQDVARIATAVVYDRGGTGWSEAAPLPRTAAAVADEARALLKEAGLPGPYVLVGHSLGGAYIRRFAQRYPNEIAGLLFLDPAHEGYVDGPKQSLLDQVRMVLAMLPALANMPKFYRPMFEHMFAAWPAALRERLVAYHCRNWRRSLDEAKTLESEVLGEIQGGGDMPNVPMIVLTAVGIDPFMAAFMREPYLRAVNAWKAGCYAAFARSMPRGENRLVDAGHSTLHTERPDAIVQAIRDLIDAAAG